MSNSPRITVVLPTQGRRPTLGVAVRSVMAQTWTDWELLVVDDAPAGDPDWTNGPDGAVLREDSRIRVLSHRQARGCASAKNAGLAAARGEWVTYVDDDNSYLPAKLERQLALAESTGAPLVLCGMEYQIGARRRLKQVGSSQFAGDALALEALADTNVLFHRRAGSPPWEADLETTDDTCFFHAWRQAAALTSVPNVPEPLVRYTVHEGPRANTDWLRLYRGQRRLVTRWLRDFPPVVRRCLTLRCLLALEKYRSGRWGRVAALSAGLLRCGGWREARFVANVIAVKLPGIRRGVIR